MNFVVQRVLDEGVGSGTPSASVKDESNITYSQVQSNVKEEAKNETP